MAAANNISLSERLLAEVQAAAEERHVAPEVVLEEALTKYFEDQSWTKWLDNNRKHADSMGIKESDVDGLIAEYRAEQRAR
jgi:predicted transcriptional regulator